MPETHLLLLNIFISSPSDLGPEREMVARAIERLNKTPLLEDLFIFKPLRFGKDVTPETGKDAQLTIDENMPIADCYMLICMMWHKMGTPYTDLQTKEKYK